MELHSLSVARKDWQIVQRKMAQPPEPWHQEKQVDWGGGHCHCQGPPKVRQQVVRNCKILTRSNGQPHQKPIQLYSQEKDEGAWQASAWWRGSLQRPFEHGERGWSGQRQCKYHKRAMLWTVAHSATRIRWLLSPIQEVEYVFETEPKGHLQGSGKPRLQIEFAGQKTKTVKRNPISRLDRRKSRNILFVSNCVKYESEVFGPYYPTTKMLFAEGGHRYNSKQRVRYVSGWHRQTKSP